MSPILGYWNIRGRVEPIRLMLTHIGETFLEKHYTFGEGPNYSAAEWQSEKYKLGMELPNLPYFFDGDRKITQSVAIMHYLAKKHNLGGTNEDEVIRVEMLEQLGLELIETLVRIAYTPKESYEKTRAFSMHMLPMKFKELNDYFAERKYALGDRLTYADFILFSAIDYFNLWEADLLKAAPNLIAHHDRIENLPSLKPYFDNPDLKRGRVFSPFATWGWVA